MVRKITLALGLICLGALLAGCTIFGSKPGGGTGENKNPLVLMYEDTFEDADASKLKWTFQNGMGEIADGVLITPADQDFGSGFPQFGSITLGDGEYDALVFEMTYRSASPFQPGDGASYLTVHFFGQGGQRFEVVIWNDEDVAKYRLDERGPQVESDMALSPVPRAPAPAHDFATYDLYPGGAETGAWQDLRVVLEANGDIAVYLDERPILGHTKAAGITGAFNQIRVMARHGFQQWEIDRVAVYGQK